VNWQIFLNREDAYLLNFGYQGMVSAIDALVDRRDVIVYDSESHACILDGARLHQGQRFVFPHNNIENLEKQLERASKITAKNRWRDIGDYGRGIWHVG
jgi:glycine C-acetyltransferase